MVGIEAVEIRRLPRRAAASGLSLALAALVAALAPSVALTARDIVINEIHYEPDDKTVPEEFVELYNRGRTTVDLSGWFFSDAIDFTFPAGTRLSPGEFLVVAEDPATILDVFGLDGALGPFTGRLSNEGDELVLRNPAGGVEDRVEYQEGFPWPLASAGRGSSMELIHPDLDNDLGGSWRASGAVLDLPDERAILIEDSAPDWSYRKGLSEASDPIDAWRSRDFVEDASWIAGATPVGYGREPIGSLLDDMEDNYSSVYLRRQFFVLGAELPRMLILRMYYDDGAIVWINGVEVFRARAPEGDVPHDETATGPHTARWEEFFLENARRFLRHGVNVVAVHAFNTSLGSNDFLIDLGLAVPAKADFTDRLLPPTPGLENTVFAENAPPQIRQVDHVPMQPAAGETAVVTAKVTDPHGVASVRVRYQVVAPGDYVPAFNALPQQLLMSRPLDPAPPNEAFEDPANWTSVDMRDDGETPDVVAGDGVFTATLPAQENRTLVRYRIAATDRRGAEVTVPYVDDGSLNFALFVYDGVPAYEVPFRTVRPEGPGHVYSAELMGSLPVYLLVTRAADLTQCIGYNGADQIPKSNENARDRFNWEGAFVYEGRVYDHVRYRLRQANDRYGGVGKRSMRIRFNKGNYLRARDNWGREYPTRWRTLNTGKMFDNKDVGNFGLTETMNAILWNKMGVPAPHFYTYHFRVVQRADEAPSGNTGQYLGDFWGMYNGIEDYDPRFLDAHGLVDGNLYKLKDGVFDGNQLRRNQGRFAITTDADFQNIRRNLRPERDAAWIDNHVNYDRWNHYHAVVEGIRHYDFVPADSHSKNRAWYFEPWEGSEFGRVWTLPWDSDASWGPNWNSGIDYSKNAISNKPLHKLEYRNVVREFRDLLWNEETLPAMIDELAEFVIEFSDADRDRWRDAPAQAGRQDFGSIVTKIADMKRFAFVGWSGSTGPTVPAGGRARHLENLANAEGDATRLPETPAIAYTGPEGFPRDALTFETTPFADPEPDDVFNGMRWRVGEVSDPTAPGFVPDAPAVIEWDAVWESELLETFESAVLVPASSIRIGHRYRARVKMRDAAGRWSHWSEPVEFVAGPPLAATAVETSLRITEMHYHPLGDNDLEFVELQNVGAETLSLEGVRFSDSIVFDFAAGAVTSLAPGAFVVVVKDRRLFELRYGSLDGVIAGEYGGRFANNGERVRLTLGETVTLLDYTFKDTWYPSTDGAGHSLVIREPGGTLGQWGLQDGWRPSLFVHGSPGRDDDSAPDGMQRPGDVTQDTRVNIADAMQILRVLFLGATTALPCGDGTFEHAANRTLLDVNADTDVDIADATHLLAHLYQGGAPPVLGTTCVPVVGCPTVCGK